MRSLFRPPSFRFLDPGRLIDQELELVAPQACWVDELLHACYHPQTIRFTPQLSHVTRQQLLDFLRVSPLGHQPAQPEKGIAPAYHFWMHVPPEGEVPLRMVGGIALRIGHSVDLEQYVGHIGYHVYPPAQGHHYAERACRLLLPLARRHGLEAVWITCNPDNVPSRRTCERLGATLVNIVPLPQDHPLYRIGERNKCRYRLEL